MTNDNNIKIIVNDEEINIQNQNEEIKMKNSQKMKSSIDTNFDTAITVGELICASWMVAIGYKNLPVEGRYSKDEIQELSEEEKMDPCPNGAAYWLFVAGITLIIAHVLFGSSKIYKWFAKRNNKGNKCFKLISDINRFASVCMTTVNFTMIIWGSIVVFGAWAKWTDNFNEFQEDPAALNYCKYEPMMFAFIFLIIQWIWFPFMVILTCLCLFSCCCCAMCLGMEFDEIQDA